MPGQNAARIMLKHFRLEDKGGRLGVLKELVTQRRKAVADPYSSGQNDPFPADL
jgi:hypothetical protein